MIMQETSKWQVLSPNDENLTLRQKFMCMGASVLLGRQIQVFQETVYLRFWRSALLSASVPRLAPRHLRICSSRAGPV